MKWKPLGWEGGSFHKILTWNFRVRLHFLENLEIWAPATYTDTVISSLGLLDLCLTS